MALFPNRYKIISISCKKAQSNSASYNLWMAEKWLPKDIHILIPRNSDYVTSYIKRDFAVVIYLTP